LSANFFIFKIKIKKIDDAILQYQSTTTVVD